MTVTNGGLIPLTSTTIATRPGVGYDDDYARKLFGSFREVFSAERLPERAIFWIEEKFGRLVIRHVQDLKKRQRKGDDRLITRTINDLAAARVMIGNYAAGCKLSTVRWEIYGDFELSNLLDMGRFDFRDLAGHVEQGHAQNLVSQGIHPAGDWDFDSIILMHRCPLCRRCFDSSAILYTSNIPCETCDKDVPLDYSMYIIKELTRGYQARLRKVSTEISTSESGEFAVQHFVDPIPNTVMYWVLHHFNAATSDDWHRIFGEGHSKMAEDMYHRSLFNLMRIEYMQNLFADYLRTLGNRIRDIEYDLGVLQRIGKALGTPSFVQAQQRKDADNDEYPDRYDISYAQEFLPEMINRIITNHAEFYQQPQLRKELPYVQH